MRVPTDRWVPGISSEASSHDEYLAFASRATLSSRRAVAGTVWAARPLRAILATHPGLVGYQLAASFRDRSMWTLSVWVDSSAFDAFVESPAHRFVVQKFRVHAAGDFVSATWRLPIPVPPPTWAEAASRLGQRKTLPPIG